MLTVDEKIATSGALPGTILLDDQPLAHGQWWVAGPKTLFVAYEPCQKLQSAQKLEARFPWTAHEVGLLFMFSGFLGILLQGGLIGRLVKRFGEAKLVLAGFVAAAAAYVVLGLAYTVTMVLIVAAISAFGNGVLRPVLTSRITQVAGRHEQGVALGISGSLSSFAMMLAPPTGGTLIDHQWLLGWALVPASVAALGFIVALSTPAGKPAAPELSSPP